MNKTNRAAVILALLAGICIGGAAAAVSHAMPGKASPTVQALYQQAIEDAVVAGEEEIYPLVEITGDSDLVTWNEKKDKVLMMTFHDTPDSYPAGESVPVQGYSVWGFSGKEFLSRYPALGKAEDWNLRMNQLIGLPADSGLTHVSALWVSPEDLIRPAYVTDVTGQMRNSFFEETPEDPDYIAWFNANAVYSYCENTYPWTRLGYTYDWAENGEEHGLSEFLLTDGAEVTVEFTKTLEEFLRWAGEETKS